MSDFEEFLKVLITITFLVALVCFFAWGINCPRVAASIAAFYVACWIIPVVLAPVWTWTVDRTRDRMQHGRAIRQAKADATVAEIKLRHELAMDKIRLDHHRVQYELKQMLQEDGVPDEAQRRKRTRG